jgi:hypothetical protein
MSYDVLQFLSLFRDLDRGQMLGLQPRNTDLLTHLLWGSITIFSQCLLKSFSARVRCGSWAITLDSFLH